MSGQYISYMEDLQDPENERVVARIINHIFDQDDLTDEIMANNLKALEAIQALGEPVIYERAVQDLKQNYGME